MKKPQPIVSVLMTAYNREAYIAEAIESVLASTFTDFELLIVDDCSTDKTVTIANSYAQKDARITVFQNEKNLTQFGNRNKAAALANGKYIKFVDSDDIIYSHTLAAMVDAMNKFPEAGLGFCLTHGPCKKPLPYLVSPEDAYRQHFFDGGLLFVGPSGLIVRSDVFHQVKGFEEYGMPSDNHFTLKVASKYPVVALERDLFWWRQHEGQVFHQNKGNYYNLINNYRYTKDLIRNYSPLPEPVNRKVLFNTKKNFLRHIYRLIVKKAKPGLALRLLLEIQKKPKG
ncbi:glycosyltransferase family 2 protein [Flavisolibacter sp. BT320]|nr:glycosyltransferase family 2 protein [Flavisolibacter longurius]